MAGWSAFDSKLEMRQTSKAGTEVCVVEQGVATFAIDGLTGPDLVPRIVGLLSQRSLVPLRLSVIRFEESTSVRIEQDKITAHQATLLAARILEIIVVRTVAVQFVISEPSENGASASNI